MRKQTLCLLLCLSLAALCACAGTEGGLRFPWTPSPTPVAESAAPAETAPPSPAEPSPPSPMPLPEPGRNELVRVRDYLPDVAVDLRYAGTDNFTGTVIYDFYEAWLRYGTVQKLRTAQESLRQQGYGLLLWDAYRPQAAQFRLWEVCPDPVYVANPYNGHSSHSNGGTVDITLVTLAGEPVEMPSGFDEFSSLADRDYRDVSPAAAEHAQILERAMTEAGFVPYAGEWWHYADGDAYPYEDLEAMGLPREGELYTPDCETSISLRTAPDVGAPALAQIPLGERFCVLGFAGEFNRISWGNMTGYVLREYIMPAQ